MGLQPLREPERVLADKKVDPRAVHHPSPWGAVVSYGLPRHNTL